MSSLVAIVGRPNVGKSTLFNRLVGYQKAIVDDRPGVTRDRNYASTELEERPVTLVDTGGFDSEEKEAMPAQVRHQTLLAIEEADLTLLVLDGRQGPSPHDRELVDLLRRSGRPFLVTVNKIDGPEVEKALDEFFSLGVEPLLPVSGSHGYGVRDLTAEIVARLPEAEDEATDENLVRVAVIGRPNVGKSSLLNRLLGEDRSLVTDVPGTTRDPVDAHLTRGDKNYLLVDTAGIRRKGKVDQKIEKYSVMRALRALDRCDVALVLVDAVEGITDQDAHVAGYALDRGRGLVLLVNKWDTVQDKRTAEKKIESDFDLKMRFAAFAPRLTISARTGLRTDRIFRLVDEVFAQFGARFPTAQVNRVMADAVTAHTPPFAGRQRLKFYYATQASTRPPTFVLFANRPDEVHFSYQRYLVNTFRHAFGLDKTQIRVLIRPHRREKS